jgi:hypothetical protein
MISEETARHLQQTATEFEAADARLRRTSAEDQIQEAAADYVRTRREHANAIERAEAECSPSGH